MSQVVTGLRFCRKTNRLMYGAVSLCKIRKNATNQMNILEAVEVSGFDTFLDCPLWDDSDDEFTNQSRTTKTITQLNKVSDGIRFSSECKGRYLKWEFTGWAKRKREKQCQR